ncbi:hypothetical protein [Nocardia sp. CC227C]|nr:hypothetical protein [Nocardia sp. CC227C]
MTRTVSVRGGSGDAWAGAGPVSGTALGVPTGLFGTVRAVPMRGG